jgi:hypothetical protein
VKERDNHQGDGADHGQDADGAAKQAAVEGFLLARTGRSLKDQDSAADDQGRQKPCANQDGSDERLGPVSEGDDASEDD